MTSWSLASLAYMIPLASFALTWVVLTVVIRVWSDRVLDHPNERSLHQRPVSRMGGIGVAAGIAVSVPFVSPVEWWPLWVGACFLVGISFLDDIIGLPIIGRLLAHFVAAGGAASGLLFDSTGAIVVLLAVMAIVWMTNLYNFMDGMDGLAGGMALFGFGFYAIAGVLSGHLPLAAISAVIAAAAGAFLFFNFHPARIFMGDAGSTLFGFLAACLGLVGWQLGIWTLWFPGLVFSPFIVDATVTLLRRLLRGEKFWRPHREHYYQRLALNGWGHRRTVLAAYGVMALCGGFALLYQYASEGWRIVILGFLGMLFFSLALGVRGVEQRIQPVGP
ncbi:MAG: glycosyltransferase family 4 protein [Nitrospira sp.]|nr:MAG: glycosyltransferase family 4 protein [Nitrospira sp.]